jgi:CO dehydrogenase/acetyl-CoA synthase delta subunit
MSRLAGRAHQLATPRRARVEADEDDGRPLAVDGRTVDAVRESWLVEDRWWNGRPVRRRYWEVVTTCGRDVVVFHDLRGGGWFAQR